MDKIRKTVRHGSLSCHRGMTSIPDEMEHEHWEDLLGGGGGVLKRVSDWRDWCSELTEILDFARGEWCWS